MKQSITTKSCFPVKLTNLLSLKIDFQKGDQHAGDKWLIHGTKRRKTTSCKTWNSPVEYYWRECKHDIKESEGNMYGVFAANEQISYGHLSQADPWTVSHIPELGFNISRIYCKTTLTKLWQMINAVYNCIYILNGTHLIDTHITWIVAFNNGFASHIKSISWCMMEWQYVICIIHRLPYQRLTYQFNFLYMIEEKLTTYILGDCLGETLIW